MVPGGPEEVEPDDRVSKRYVGQSMKKFTIEVSNASGPQLLTIAAELKIMSNGWAKYGPRIWINKQALQPPQLRVPSTSKRAIHKRHNMNTFQ